MMSLSAGCTWAIVKAHTPGASKQHRFVCLVVLWHDVWPLVPQPELIEVARENRFMVSTGDTKAAAIADPTKEPRTRAAAIMVTMRGGKAQGLDTHCLRVTEQIYSAQR